MASTAQLPLFYNGLEPLSSDTHANFKVRPQDSAPFLVGQHALFHRDAALWIATAPDAAPRHPSP